MATDRGRRRTVRSNNKGAAPVSVLDGVQLAAGVRLVRTGARQKSLVLACADGKVPLNEGAVAILNLCDGSRSREEIVTEIAQRSLGGTLAADIRAFLDAACSRGWIIDPKSAPPNRPA